MQFIMKKKATGELEIVDNMELALNMIDSGKWLFGFLSFVDKEHFFSSLDAMYKAVRE